MPPQHRKLIVALVMFMTVCHQCMWTDESTTSGCTDVVSTFTDKASMVEFLLKQSHDARTTACQAFEATRLEYEVKIENKEIPRTITDTVEVKREIKFK